MDERHRPEQGRRGVLRRVQGKSPQVHQQLLLETAVPVASGTIEILEMLQIYIGQPSYVMTLL